MTNGQGERKFLLPSTAQILRFHPGPHHGEAGASKVSQTTEIEERILEGSDGRGRGREFGSDMLGHVGHLEIIYINRAEQARPEESGVLTKSGLQDFAGPTPRCVPVNYQLQGGTKIEASLAHSLRMAL